VADTLLIAKHADTLFMWLSQLLEKRMLNIANNLYKEQKLPNMCLLLMIQTRLKDMVTAMVMVKP
jgi:hypothetical protein